MKKKHGIRFGKRDPDEFIDFEEGDSEDDDTRVDFASLRAQDQREHLTELWR